MNALLFDTVRRENPDVLFCVLFENQLSRETMKAISGHTPTRTVNWFCDDHWRFDEFSRHWAPAFNWIATTVPNAFERYKTMPGVAPILTQWAVNPERYEAEPGGDRSGITFIGQRRPARERHVSALRRANLPIEAWGYGWPDGRLSEPDMAMKLAESAIVLNFSDASRKRKLSRKPLTQMKARVFELGATGGLVVTEYDPDLPSFYDIGKEIVSFRTPRELVRACRYFTSNPEEAARVAAAGYSRTLQSHTYRHRLAEIFGIMGLRSSPGAPATSEVMIR